jgi:hypothetical protein
VKITISQQNLFPTMHSLEEPSTVPTLPRRQLHRCWRARLMSCRGRWWRDHRRRWDRSPLHQCRHRPRPPQRSARPPAPLLPHRHHHRRLPSPGGQGAPARPARAQPFHRLLHPLHGARSVPAPCHGASLSGWLCAHPSPSLPRLTSKLW